MKTRLERWREFLSINNIILIITLLVGLITLAASIFVPGLSLVEQALLAVLLGLAGAQLSSNYATIKQEEKWDTHNRLQQEMAQAIRDFPAGILKPRSDIVPIDKFTESAEDILIVARTGSKVTSNINFFCKQLESGCRLRFVVLNPEACQENYLESVSPKPLMGKEALDVFKAELTAALANIRYLTTLAEKTKGKVELRLISYVSNLSFIVVDESNGRGKVLLEMTPYKCEELERPHIELASDDPNPRRYKFFRSICEEIWKNAAPNLKCINEQ